MTRLSESPLVVVVAAAVETVAIDEPPEAHDDTRAAETTTNIEIRRRAVCELMVGTVTSAAFGDDGHESPDALEMYGMGKGARRLYQS